MGAGRGIIESLQSKTIFILDETRQIKVLGELLQQSTTTANFISISGRWFGTCFFPYILGIIIPTDQYFSEGLKPPIRY